MCDCEIPGGGAVSESRWLETNHRENDTEAYKERERLRGAVLFGLCSFNSFVANSPVCKRFEGVSHDRSQDPRGDAKDLIPSFICSFAQLYFSNNIPQFLTNRIPLNRHGNQSHANLKKNKIKNAKDDTCVTISTQNAGRHEINNMKLNKKLS